MQELYEKTMEGGVTTESFDMSRFEPVKSMLVVKLLPKDEQTRGGIFLPEESRAEKPIGIVTAVNPEDIDCPYSIGDTLLCHLSAGETLPFRDVEDYRILFWETDIVGRIKKE